MPREVHLILLGARESLALHCIYANSSAQVECKFAAQLISHTSAWPARSSPANRSARCSALIGYRGKTTLARHRESSQLSRLNSQSQACRLSIPPPSPSELRGRPQFGGLSSVSSHRIGLVKLNTMQCHHNHCSSRRAVPRNTRDRRQSSRPLHSGVSQLETSLSRN